MKIIIVGAGISGLTLHHFLRKHLPEDAAITTYESYTSFTALGGGLGLAPNGLYVFRLISESLQKNIIENGVQSDKFELRNSVGSTLGVFSAGNKDRYLNTGGNLMVKRSVIHDALRHDVRADVVYGKKVVDVREQNDEVQVVFEDGSETVADIVIGGDGMNSIVRKSVYPGSDAIYEGFTGVGGFVSSSIIPISERLKTVMTFGPDGFFGYSPVNTDQHQWWSTYATKTPPARTTPFSVILPQLRERHGSWINSSSEKLINTIIDTAERESLAKNGAKSVLVLPSYELRRLSQYGSPSGRILLMGDAAHVMPPHSGQGVSLAAEDAYTIALLLSSSFTKTASVTPNIVAAYTKLRKPRIDKILTEAGRQGNAKKKQSPLQEKIRDFMIGVMCKWIPESWSDWKFGYRVDEIVAQYLEGLKV